MKTNKQFLRFSALALAVALAWAPAYGQDAPSAEIEVTGGVGFVSGDERDRAFFGQYNGLRERDVFGTVGLGYWRLNPATGTVVEANVNELLLDTRELTALWRRQGKWGLNLGYGELLRRDPYSLNTGLSGVGSAAPVVNRLATPGSGFIFDLEQRRKTVEGGVEYWISPAWQAMLNLSSQKKEGSRLFGIGFACPSALAFTCGGTTATQVGSALLALPEPVDSRHNQAEARLSFSGEQLFVSGGYYGSFYNNANGAMYPSVISPTLNNPLGEGLAPSAGLVGILNNPVALAPDNQAHQFDVTGNYRFTSTTRANFRLAHATARQNQSFAEAGLLGAPAGASSLGGRLDTSTVQVGLSSRPIAKLALAADWRYEDREDKTPLARYTVRGTDTFTNRNYSSTRMRSKLQASYQLPWSLLASAGVDYEWIDRGAFTRSSTVAGVSGLRQETTETGYRFELRRQMTESISGSVAYITSERTGSSWLRPNALAGVTEVPASGFLPGAVFPSHLMDRQRDRVRLFGAWQATEALALQVAVEAGEDSYDAPTDYALRKVETRLYSLDASYAINDEWSVHGYLARDQQKLNQAKPLGYVMDLDNRNVTAGIGFNGKPTEQIELGGTLSRIKDRSLYAQALDPGASLNAALLLAATGGLPDTLFRRTELRLFGRYALSEQSSVRLDALHQRYRFDDWAFDYAGVPFLYSDNTTVISPQQSQRVTVLGVSYTYVFR